MSGKGELIPPAVCSGCKGAMPCYEGKTADVVAYWCGSCKWGVVLNRLMLPDAQACIDLRWSVDSRLVKRAGEDGGA